MDTCSQYSNFKDPFLWIYSFFHKEKQIKTFPLRNHVHNLI